MPKSNAHVNIYGRVIADPQNNTTSNNASATTFRVAVWTSEKLDPEKTTNYDPQYQYKNDFYNVTAWGKMGDDLMKNLQKGSMVNVGGDQVFHVWTDRNGKPQFNVNIQANYVEITSGRKNANEQPAQNNKNDDTEPPF